MFLKKTYSKNHTYLSLSETYREDGKVRHRVIAQLGRLDTLLQNDQLKRLAESFERLCDKKKKFSIEDFEELDRVNWGAEKVYKSLWNQFEFQKIFDNIFHERKTTFSISETVFLEVISRLLKPCSKLKLYETQNKYFGINESSLHHLYRVLDLLSDGKERIEKEIFEKNKSLFNSAVDVVFYDVTTLYFESVIADGLKDFGYSKDCKFSEVQVVLGLLVDTDGRPVGFDVFKGNTFEAKTLCAALIKLKERFNIRDIIIVADRGINSKMNLKLIKDNGFNYIVGSRLKTMKKQVKSDVLNKCNYKTLYNDEERTTLTYSFSYENEIEYCSENGVRLKEKLDEQLHCTWDSKRAEKDRKDRKRLIAKAEIIIASGGDGKDKRGAKKYIKSSKNNKNLTLDEAKIYDEEKWDGFYGIQTSKKDMSTEEVLAAYKRLWKIEESFRILKSSLQARPMFHWSEKRIRGHLVICFIAFLLQRSLELILIEKQYEHSPEKIRDAIDKMELSIVKIEDQKMYLCSKLSGLSCDILRALKIAIPKHLTLLEQF
jgi:transposase